MRTPRRFQESQTFFPLWVWCVFFLGLWQILLWAQPPSILMDDSGEMIAASWNLGLPHPPGYPLFDLLGHIFSWIAVGSVSFRFSLLSSLIVLFSLVLVLKTCRLLIYELSIKQSLSTIKAELLLVFVALAFVFNDSVFSQCLSAKGCVYALTLLMISVLVWLSVLKTDGKLIYFAWFLWGVAMANHWQTSILWMPFLVIFSLTRIQTTIKSVVFAGLSILFGLSLYLCLPLRAALKAQPSWGDPLHWADFKWVVFRQLVAGEEMKAHSFAFYRDGLWAVLQSTQLWLPGVIVLAVLGLWKMNRDNKPLSLLLYILFLPVVLALIAVHEPNNLYLIPVYLVPLMGLVSILSFVGLLWLLTKKGSPFQMTVLLLLISFATFWGWTVFETQNRDRYMLAEDFGVNTMKFLPKGALLLADGDNYVMPLWYIKYVLGKRSDLTIEPMVFLYHEWGWNQLVQQSSDLNGLVLSSLPYRERLIRLVEDFKHPFFYSFGRQFYPPVLDKIQGKWTSYGLAMKWTDINVSTERQSRKLRRIIDTERFRGIDENREVLSLDKPTNDIYYSYVRQLIDQSFWFQAQKENLKAVGQLEYALYLKPKDVSVYDYLALLIDRMGYLRMARSLADLGITAAPKLGLSYAILSKVEKEEGLEAEAKRNYEIARSLAVNPEWIEDHKAANRILKDKSGMEYKKWSETLRKAGCPFLSQLALNCSESMIKPLN
ncbi:MAG TPA: DUF2723 domain-containing protein [bacterium]|nr:DUF2723 domain-containing protein [bacterium]